jgi:RNA polymerase sigma-70 factor (ECF subfamily)
MGIPDVARIDEVRSMPADKPESNRELLAAYRRGDRRAAERLVEATYSGVFAALCRLSGDRSLAADLTQETYRKAWQSLDSFAGRSKVATWLFRIAYTTFLNHVRGNSRFQSLEESPLVLVDDSPSQGDVLALEEEGSIVRDRVLRLPAAQRDVLVARYWGEVSVRDIAREQGVTSVAIRKRIKKALSLLAGQLEEVDR